MTVVTEYNQVCVKFATQSGVGLVVNLQAVPGATLIALGRFPLKPAAESDPVPALEVNGSIPLRSDFVYLSGHV